MVGGIFRCDRCARIFKNAAGRAAHLRAHEARSQDVPHVADDSQDNLNNSHNTAAAADVVKGNPPTADEVSSVPAEEFIQSGEYALPAHGQTRPITSEEEQENNASGNVHEGNSALACTTSLIDQNSGVIGMSTRKRSIPHSYSTECTAPTAIKRPNIDEELNQIAECPTAEQPHLAPLRSENETNHFDDPFGQLVLDKYYELADNLPQNRRKAKTLAAIIMTKGTTTTIISLATGNKRFKSNTGASAGNGLKDCNAEVLARRGLVYFLYNQLMAAHETGINTPEESVLMTSDAGRYKLKADVRLYLWMCGGGHFVRPFIFNPQGGGGGGGAQVVEGMAQDGGSGSTAGGHVASGSATGGGPVLGDNVDKPRSGAMSCNVKVAKWNVVGLQGALLSLYLDPVYLSGLILDNVNHYQHLHAEMYDRLSSLTASLPAGFQLSNPPITYSAVGLARHENQDHAHIWVIGEAEMEVISCKRGLTHTDARSSKLSKRALFVKFTNLWKKTPPPDLTTPGHVEGAVLPRGSSAPPLPPHLYRCAKMLSENYQAAKKATLSAFVATGLGPWPHQPIYDEFHL